MKHEVLEAADPGLIDAVARSCGEVTIGCVDVGGLIGEVITAADEMKLRQDALEDVMQRLSADQENVKHSADESRALSQRARTELRASTQVVRESMREFAELTDLVVALAQHITGFAGAMQQVRNVTLTIDTIADTTNMLALNATIEAHRAGEAGATFAVVAAEVKKLAQDTRVATDEITGTITSLDKEAGALVEKINKGVNQGAKAQADLATIDATVQQIAQLVDEVDRQNGQIADSTDLIHSRVHDARGELEHFSASAAANSVKLEDMKTRVHSLEWTSMTMFDQLVRSGFASEDRRFVDIAIAGRDRIAALVEAAIADGSLAESDVFDREYRPIPGSDPVRYDNRFTAFADAHIQPILDAHKARHSEIISSVASNMDGYLPTHLSERSRKPTGDREHDDKFCRNRRQFLDEVTQRAIDLKDEPFTASCYRYMRAGDTKPSAAKNIFVPIRINGKYWGNFEILYLN